MLPIAATGQAFEVASVKPSKPGAQSNSNFPLGPGDVYVPNGGYFSATGFPLVTYIFFAYKMAGNQAQSLLAPELLLGGLHIGHMTGQPVMQLHF